MSEVRYDIVIVGGSLEGAAAAWSAAQHGATVCLIEASGRLGGRYTVPEATRSEEGHSVETTGEAHAYRLFREAVKDYYSNADSFFASGTAHPQSPTALTMTPPVDHEILSLLLASQPNVQVRLHTTVTQVDTNGDTIVSLTAVDPIGSTRCLASYFLDATDFGELQPLDRQREADRGPGRSQSDKIRETQPPYGKPKRRIRRDQSPWRGTAVLPDQAAPWQFGSNCAF